MVMHVFLMDFALKNKSIATPIQKRSVRYDLSYDILSLASNKI